MFRGPQPNLITNELKTHGLIVLLIFLLFLLKNPNYYQGNLLSLGYK